jgi:hypothetical protein
MFKALVSNCQRLRVKIHSEQFTVGRARFQDAAGVTSCADSGVKIFARADWAQSGYNFMVKYW